MADEITAAVELGEDADLLLAPDEWLENKRISLQQRLSLTAKELEGVLAAQRIKGSLQQRNMVAVRCVDKKHGVPSDIIIKFCPISDAIARLETEKEDATIPDDISSDNIRQHIDTWQSDGYDIDTVRKLRKQKR